MTDKNKNVILLVNNSCDVILSQQKTLNLQMYKDYSVSI